MKNCSIPNCSNANTKTIKNLCKLHYQQKRRKETANIHTHKYEKTINGFLMRTYRNMKSRVTGVQWKKFHLYEGKTILDKASFYEWSKNNANFLNLFNEWEKNNYIMKLTPSINRINPKFGYELGNIEWITHSLNSALSSKTRNK